MATQIDRTTREVVRDVALPYIERMIDERIDAAVYRAVEHLEPGLIQQQVRDAVRSLIAQRITIDVTVADV